MGSDVASWRLSIGLFYGKAYGIVIRSYTGKIPFSFIYLMQFFQRLKKLFWLLSSTIYHSINKDRTNYGGGILVYINTNLLHKRRPDLEIFWEGSVWVEIKINKQQYLLGTFYSPKPQDRVFFESLDRNIEKAMEYSQNIVILGDLNEDLLNENYKNLRDIMMTNSFQNIITEPTRGRALLDPILVPDDLTTYDSGVIANLSQISDHSATFLILPHNYSVSVSFIRRVWFYKRAN